MRGRTGSHSRPALSHREQEILEYVARGWSARQVAERIKLAPRTVERHIENIRQKMNARNAPHMIARAYAMGMLKRNLTERRRADPPSPDPAEVEEPLGVADES